MGKLLDSLGVTISSPWWLLGLLLIPPLVWFSRKSLAGLGGPRRALALACRSGVVALLVLALAELQSVRITDKLTTIFVLDDSESIPSEMRRPMMELVNQAVKSQRRGDDQAGVIVFGREAKIESPPSVNPEKLTGITNPPDPQYTDLSSAIKLALASFSDDTARRIVVLSDGNENRGSAIQQASAASSLGVPIDVVPIEYVYDQDVRVEKIALPPDVKEGETVNINIVLRASSPAKGGLQVYQQAADSAPQPALDNEEPIPVDLQRGLNVFTIKQKIEKPNFYRFSAEFFPGEAGTDRRLMNNKADGFTNARGAARILLIEGTANEHAELVQALRENEIQVDVRVAPRVDGTSGGDGAGGQGGDPIPTEAAQVQPYDVIILANVPKDAFTEGQHQLFETATHDMGIGLMMIGGPDAFGAGRWMNTPVEKALPVDMQLRSEKFAGKGALALIMHASEIPQGNFWQAKVAQEALKSLSAYDYAGLIHWQGQEAWLFPLQTVGPNRGRMLRAIDQMTPGDMPGFTSSMTMAMQALLKKTDATNRHIIVISDGDPDPPPASLLSQMARNKVTVTTCAVAAHGNDPGALRLMNDIAQKTKGRFYNVTNPKALPRIYQKEIRLISRPLIHADEKGWMPKFTYSSEPLTGIEGVPPIRGMVLTEKKQSELVEMPLGSDQPAGRAELWPVLAHWNYGLGRSLAFTPDAGRRWTTNWVTWDGYKAFWTQIVRWTMRPVDSGNLKVTLRRDQGELKVVVDALDKNDEFLNSLLIAGNVVRPEVGDREQVVLRQVAPGRYEATIPNAEARGNYFVTLSYKGQGYSGLVSSGIAVPYSDEYRDDRSNRSILETIASLSGGEALDWSRRPDGAVDLDGTLSNADFFRRDPKISPPRSTSDLWPPLLFSAAFLFLLDVGVRRLAPDTARIKRAIANQVRKWRGREQVQVSEYMEKLKGRKAEVNEALDKARAATKFEAPPEASPGEGTAGQAPPESLADDIAAALSRASEPAKPRPSLSPSEKPAEPESYASRLLKAKQRVWEEQQKKEKPKDD